MASLQRRFSCAPWATLALVVAGVLAGAGCQQILGIGDRHLGQRDAGADLDAGVRPDAPREAGNTGDGPVGDGSSGDAPPTEVAFNVGFRCSLTP